MAVLITQTCCVIIYLRLWAPSHSTRTTDPWCHWLWKQEHSSSVLNPAQCWPVSRDRSGGKGPTLGSAGQYDSLPFFLSPLLHPGPHCRPTHSCITPVGSGPPQSLTRHTCSPKGSLLTGGSSGSELDLDSSHSSVIHCYCHLYWGKKTLPHAVEGVKEGMNARFLAHFLDIEENNNKNKSCRYWIFTWCNYSFVVASFHCGCLAEQPALSYRLAPLYPHTFALQGKKWLGLGARTGCHVSQLLFPYFLVSAYP